MDRFAGSRIPRGQWPVKRFLSCTHRPRCGRRVGAAWGACPAK